MSVRLGIVMDPIAQISYKKDSSLAMLLAAQARGWSLFYMEQKDSTRPPVSLAAARARSRCSPIPSTGSNSVTSRTCPWPNST